MFRNHLSDMFIFVLFLILLISLVKWTVQCWFWLVYLYFSFSQFADPFQCWKLLESVEFLKNSPFAGDPLGEQHSLIFSSCYEFVWDSFEISSSCSINALLFGLRTWMNCAICWTVLGCALETCLFVELYQRDIVLRLDVTHR